MAPILRLLLAEMDREHPKRGLHSHLGIEGRGWTG
jgi:hypothetical protein